MDNAILQAALMYAFVGFRVLPLQPCGKIPKIPNWQKDASRDPEQIKKWWQKYPNANVGIRCGETGTDGKYLTVIDLDVHDEKTDPKTGKIKPKVNGFKTFYDWQKEFQVIFPDTLTAKTGSGGLHLYFWTDKEYKSTSNLLKNYETNSGVDVRCTGGQVVAAPSIHESGKRYEFEGGFDISKIADASKQMKALSDYCAEKGQEKKSAAPVSTVQAAPKERKKQKDIISVIAEKLGLAFTQGSRNGDIHKLASSLQARGFTDNKIIKLCEKANQERCSPPLDPKEVETAVQSAFKLQKGIPP